MEVVVIDDDEELLHVVDRILTKLGFNSRAFTTAKNAIRDIYENPPDVLICDLILESENGLEVIKAILDRIPNLTVLLITGYNLQSAQLIDWEVLKYSHKNSKFIFINKPFGYEDLRKSLLNVIE